MSWHVWIDRGGTFTDVVARDPEGQLHVRKLLSENPERYADAGIEAIRRLLPEAPSAANLGDVRMGTTVATNALLERHGSRVGLLITAGCEDLLEIGTQARPDLFALEIKKALPLAERVVGVRERLAADGSVALTLDEEHLRAELAELQEAGIEALAVVLLHSTTNPEHERRVLELARDLGFAHVSLSHSAGGEVGATARGETTCADAYLTPILRGYVEQVRDALGADVPLTFMQSNGGLVEATRFQGKDAVLSGPAGGVVACMHVARRAGVPKAIGFDMGGTSTDVCRVDEAGAETVFSREVAGVRLTVPMLNVSTIAAGGGSLLSCDGRRLRVGPESAGSVPGPVCYRRQGGRLALTDANLLLGRIQPQLFPACFGPKGDAPLDPEPAEAALAELAHEVSQASGQQTSAIDVALGCVRIANESMAQAIEEISVARGHDVTEYALVCFGGAGGQHACAVADRLSMKTVVLSPWAGVLSAYGIGLADLLQHQVHPLLQDWDAVDPEALEREWATLDANGRRALREQGIPAARIGVKRSVELRYRGVDATLEVPWSDTLGEVQAAFAAKHCATYGFDRPGHALELVNLRVVARGTAALAPPPAPAVEPCPTPDPVDRVELYAPNTDGPVEAPVYQRETLPLGCALSGPALVIDAVSTTVIDPGWSGRLDGEGSLILTREGPVDALRAPERCDPVFLEIMANRFMSIAEQMGLTLQRVSLSVNIKERLDFSCAVFDAEGQLIANAPHIPVHLGAMSESVRAVLTSRADDVHPGDVYLTNDPYAGGSHLPDVTVITPVFCGGTRPAFFVASRGHHADIGGIQPGSMPPFSRSIDEEGVRLHDFLLVRDGSFRHGATREALLAGPYPVRGVDEMVADLEAQIAANARGSALLVELAEEQGLAVVSAYMGYVQDDAEAAMRDAIAQLPDGEHRFVDYLDEGAPIAVTVTIAGDGARIDFSGTAPTLAGNLNAPRAVVLAATLYVFRTLIARPIPLNAGCLRPLEVIVPPGSLLDPKPPAAVVGGNVETSQRVVDALYGALGKLAAAQGTMNNLTFGGPGFGYYETICGGAGAGNGFDGASAVHTHMTNTRITDPEILELRFPVVVERFGVRRGSGGAGVYRGGDGVVRALRFTTPLDVAILSERRGVAPFGLHGAQPGAPGRNWLLRDGRRRSLPAKVQLEVEAGDTVVIETPGGGGYTPTPAEWARTTPRELRELVARGRYRGPTCGIADGRVQANLVVLPAALADAFAAYCQANPGPCPLIERLPEGDPHSRLLAAGADLRNVLPRYRVHAAGIMREVDDLHSAWRDDSVAFLLGCSFSLEGALAAGGVPVRHVEEGKNVPMYRTTRRTQAVGPFGGALVVTMRPMHPERVEAARQISAPLWVGHGAPIHVGDPAALGIADLAAPEWGDAVTLHPGEVPVFWPCGVTSQVALEGALAKGELLWACTHAPGHMLVGDPTPEELVAQRPQPT